MDKDKLSEDVTTPCSIPLRNNLCPRPCATKTLLIQDQETSGIQGIRRLASSADSAGGSQTPFGHRKGTVAPFNPYSGALQTTPAAQSSVRPELCYLAPLPRKAILQGDLQLRKTPADHSCYAAPRKGTLHMYNLRLHHYLEYTRNLVPCYTAPMHIALDTSRLWPMAIIGLRRKRRSEACDGGDIHHGCSRLVGSNELQ